MLFGGTQIRFNWRNPGLNHGLYGGNTSLLYSIPTFPMLTMLSALLNSLQSTRSMYIRARELPGLDSQAPDKFGGVLLLLQILRYISPPHQTREGSSGRLFRYKDCPSLTIG